MKRANFDESPSARDDGDVTQTRQRTGTEAQTPDPAHPELGGRRSNQKLRTRNAIIAATRELIRGGGEVTMPAVAQAALVSEATAYRYFPDLGTLLRESFTGLLPDPAEAMASVAECADPVERVEHATRFLLGHVLAYQGAVRAMMSAAITEAQGGAIRPGLRFGLIDSALAPLERAGGSGSAAETAFALVQLKRDLALVVSAEALFTLTDLCGLSPDEAIDSAVHAARALTQAAMESGLRLPE
jgi:AcrR family transcriptional regulator